MKIYTKKGDKGWTSLYCGKKVTKSDIICNILGANDELTSNIGVAISFIRQKKIRDELRQIQKWIQALNSHIATLSGKYFESTRFKDACCATIFLENKIDEMTLELPKLGEFILPGGKTKESSFIHMCRTSARRSERIMCITKMEEEKNIDVCEINKESFEFMNRLSDYFFTLARYLDHQPRKSICSFFSLRF